MGVSTARTKATSSIDGNASRGTLISWRGACSTPGWTAMIGTIGQLIARTEEAVRARATRSLLPTKTFLKIVRDTECRAYQESLANSTLSARLSPSEASEADPEYGSSGRTSFEEILEQRCKHSASMHAPSSSANAWARSPPRDTLGPFFQPKLPVEVFIGPIFEDSPFPEQSMSSIVKKTMPSAPNPLKRALERITRVDNGILRIPLVPPKRKMKLGHLDAKLLEYEHLILFLRQNGKTKIPKCTQNVLKQAIEVDSGPDGCPLESLVLSPTFTGNMKLFEKLKVVVKSLEARKRHVLAILDTEMNIKYDGPYSRESLFWQAVKDTIAVIDDQHLSTVQNNSPRELAKMYRRHLAGYYNH